MGERREVKKPTRDHFCVLDLWGVWGLWRAVLVGLEFSVVLSIIKPTL